MKKFLLDENPNIGETEVEIDGTRYHLEMVKNNGCYFTKYEKGVFIDQITLMRKDLKGLFMLLCTEK